MLLVDIEVNGHYRSYGEATSGGERRPTELLNK